MTTLPVGSTADKIEKWFKARLNEPQKTDSAKKPSSTEPPDPFEAFDVVVIQTKKAPSSEEGTSFVANIRAGWNGARATVLRVEGKIVSGWDQISDSLKKAFGAVDDLKTTVAQAQANVDKVNASRASNAEVEEVTQEQIKIVAKKRDETVAILMKEGSPAAILVAKQLAAASTFKELCSALDEYGKIKGQLSADDRVVITRLAAYQHQYISLSEMEKFGQALKSGNVDDLSAIAEEQYAAQASLARITDMTTVVLASNAPESAKNEVKEAVREAQEHSASIASMLIKADKEIGFLTSDQTLCLSQMILSQTASEGKEIIEENLSGSDLQSQERISAFTNAAIFTINEIYDALRSSMEREQAEEQNAAKNAENKKLEEKIQERKEEEKMKGRKQQGLMSARNQVGRKAYQKRIELASLLRDLNSTADGLIGSLAYEQNRSSLQDEIRVLEGNEALLAELQKVIFKTASLS